VTPLALTLASALLYGAAVPPLALAPVGWVMLTPFLAAAARVAPRRAALLGLLWERPRRGRRRGGSRG